MKLSILLIPALLLAQSTPLQDAATAIQRAQSQIDAMQSTIAAQAGQIATQQAMIAALQSSDGATLLALLNAKCDGCADYLRTTLPGAGKLDGVIVLCCGPSTVPDTQGRQMLYFYSTLKSGIQVKQ